MVAQQIRGRHPDQGPRPEVFADFIEMAEHLLDERYKDPAAVIIGSVLEEHLRQLCLSAGIRTEDVSATKVVPYKADRLNADLAKAGKYSKLDQKQVTAWLDLRNRAAHGKYAEYALEQVALPFIDRLLTTAFSPAASDLRPIFGVTRRPFPTSPSRSLRIATASPFSSLPVLSKRRLPLSCSAKESIALALPRVSATEYPRR